MIWNVQAVLVVPGFTFITLSHFVTLLLRQAAGAVKIYCLSLLSYARTPSLACNGKAGQTTLLQAIGQVLPDGLVIKPDGTRVIPMTNVVGKSYG